MDSESKILLQAIASGTISDADRVRVIISEARETASRLANEHLELIVLLRDAEKRFFQDAML